MNKFVLCVSLSCAALAASAQQPPPADAGAGPKKVQWPKPVDPPKPIDSSMSALTNSPIRMVEPGIFQIGQVRLDQRRRSVTFPAELNRAEGPMEYFLVTSYGKTHESVLKTPVLPFHIHLAMLLLGAEGAGASDLSSSPTNVMPNPVINPKEAPPGKGAPGAVKWDQAEHPNGVPGFVVNPGKEALPGSMVSVSVKWNGAEHPAEDLVYNADSKSVMNRGSWVYNGSLIVRNNFLAQMDGSIISLVTDPAALINNVGPGHDNDLIWAAQTNSVPAPRVPVEVTITLEDKPK